MDTIKKQAAKLREQVAKQQHALLKHLGHIATDTIVVDEAESRCYQHLQSLYKSTRDAKHFQKHIVRGVEGYLATSTKQMEIARKLANECCKYAAENQNAPFPLSNVAHQLGSSFDLMEKEREALIGTLGNHVTEPLRGMITGAPLEDARYLTNRYDKLRQEVEAQAADILKRRAKTKDSDITAENCLKLRGAEARLQELKSTLLALGREATAAMTAVEDQQQQITAQRLSTMVDAERHYHRNVIAILDTLYSEMITAGQQDELQRKPAIMQQEKTENEGLFIAKVVHPFDAEAEGELTLQVDDYVVVRQVDDMGWSEGECGGNAGWFPSAYVERQETAPASKMAANPTM